MSDHVSFMAFHKRLKILTSGIRANSQFESLRIVILVLIVFHMYVLEFNNSGFGFVECKNNFVVYLVVQVKVYKILGFHQDMVLFS